MTEDTFQPPHGRGLRWGQEDRRDRALYKTIPNVDLLPATATATGIRDRLPPPMDQGPIGACVGYGTAQNAFAAMAKDGRRRPFIPSPVALYLWAREEGGYPQEDAGAEIRNAFKMVNRYGLPAMSNLKPRFEPRDLPDPETWLFPQTSIWIRSISPSNMADAERRQVVSYRKLPLLADMLQCLADGRPVCFGFTMFRSFYDAYGNARKIIPMPRNGERDFGGHCVNAIDYDKPARLIWCRNQWGEEAHEGGPDFALPFDFVAAYASDAWVTESVEGAPAA